MKLLIPLVCSMLFAGCANSNNIPVNVVFAHGNCQQAKEGVTRVVFADLAALRGAVLLGFDTKDGAPTEPSLDGLMLVAIAGGERPTAGYSLNLDGPANIDDGLLTLHVTTSAPAPGAMLAQVITRPCLVVSVPSTGFSRLRVVDEAGNLLGELAP